jgi:hypothetical protein
VLSPHNIGGKGLHFRNEVGLDIVRINSKPFIPSTPVRIQANPLPIFIALQSYLRFINLPFFGVMSFLRRGKSTDLTTPHLGKRPFREYFIEELNNK